jgi:menaquinone-specific isochorismate synthase
MTPRPAPPADARRLVARTRRIDGPVDLLAAAGHDGLLWRRERGGLAGRGTALAVVLPGGLERDAGRVREALARIACDDEVRRPGTGPVAVGALPFDGGEPATLTVPRVTVGSDGDAAWVTTVSGGDGYGDAGAERAEMLAAAAGAGAPRPAGREAPDGFELVPAMAHAEWMERVAEAVEHIRAGDLAKVVLARRVDVTANRPFLTSDVLERLVALYPSCMVFRVGGFLGASPELLVGRRDRDVRSHPLAGTVARSGDAAADRSLVEALLASVKDRAEHAFVVDELRSALAPLCDRLDIPSRPSVLELRNVSHLGTTIRGRLRAGAAPSALELVAAVHPTPAVAGTPTDKAVAYLQTAEGFDRDRYAGPVGWVDGRGDGEWAIGIRSATVDGARASMCAGVGVVADSDPRAELAETQLKLQALLAALVRP